MSSPQQRYDARRQDPELSPVGGFPEELLRAQVGVAEQPPGGDGGVEAAPGSLHAVRRGIRSRRFVPPESSDLREGTHTAVAIIPSTTGIAANKHVPEEFPGFERSFEARG